METTPLQDKWMDIITEEENQTKYRNISPGLYWECDQCQSDYDMDETELKAGIEDGTVCDEGGFSMHDCELCGCPLDGDRYAAHGWSPDGEIVHYDICSDCLFYLANGDVPDDEYLEWIKS